LSPLSKTPEGFSKVPEGPGVMVDRVRPFRLSYRKGIVVRINVYAQELTKDIELVHSFVADTGITYYGVRIYLHSSDLLHHTPEDDDRSAITFWIPNAASYTPEEFGNLLYEMGKLVHDAPTLYPN
jgi:hypothetical protein